MSKCAKCESEMDRVQLGEMEIDVCPACRGIWFDAEELMKAVKLDEAELVKTGDPAPGSPREEGWDPEPSFCPRCSAALNPQRLDHDLAVIVDVCPAGHGVWLDKGEFPAVRAFFGEAFERIAKHQNQSLQEIKDAAKPVEKPVDPDELLGKFLCATEKAKAGYIYDEDITKTLKFRTGSPWSTFQPGSEAGDVRKEILDRGIPGLNEKPFKWSS